MSLASEQNPIGSKRPPIGLGLAEAILGTIGSLEEQAGRIRHVIGDLNGERYRAIEWSYAEMRAFANYDAERLVWFHADCIGDTGCASGGVSLIYALASLRAGLVQAEPILVFSSADDGQRASVMVSSQLRTLSTA